MKEQQKKENGKKTVKTNQKKKDTSLIKPTINRIVDIETGEDALYCYAQIIVYETKEKAKEAASKIHWKSTGYKFLKSEGEDGFINCWTALAEEISKEMGVSLEICVRALTTQHMSYSKRGKNLSGNDYPKKLTAKDFPTPNEGGASPE